VSGGALVLAMLAAEGLTVVLGDRPLERFAGAGSREESGASAIDALAGKS